MARIVVVGAGVAGLAVAIRLADFGHQVTILERNGAAGGQIGADTLDGVPVDTGPTCFTLPAVFRDLFGKTGRPLEREVDLVPLDPSVRYVFPDGEILDLPNASRAETIASIDHTLGKGVGAQWDQMVQEARTMWEVLRPRLIDRCPSLRDLLWLRLHPRARRALHRGRSLREFGAQHLRDPHLQLVLDSYATTLGSVPAQAPAALAALVYVEQTFGTWTVRGGLRVFIDALQRRVGERGGEIRFEAPAERVATRAGSVSSVELAGGETIPADVVVSTVPAGQLDLDGLRGRRWTAPPAEGRSVFSIMMSLRSRPDFPERTVLLTDDGPNVTLNYRADHQSDRPCGVALHADCSAHGPEPQLTDWSTPGTAETHAHQLLGLAAARGVDLKSQALTWRVRSPYDLECTLGAPGGRVYGPPWHGSGVTRRRLANRSPVHGLFFAGAGAHPGASLPMVAISAALVADLVGRP
ncbi:phytoene desaturase family protein [Phytoactinopolyspora limicola]|uniref:phytoene desaturase family protein n=1 Tax=Phytoactinopolyspora limicola TaxID=2715536 RepID=UPI0014096A28|nr:FAD-dependent oxidoreductase [Phytoactinopolyspora limicola]